MTTRKKLFWILLGLAALGLLVWVLWPAPVPVSAAEVRAGPFVEWVDDEGRTGLRDTFTVSAPIGGFLQRVELEPGDFVERGQVVFRLDPHPAPALDARSREQAQANLAAARARLDSTQAQRGIGQADLRFAESECQRIEQLRAREQVSAAEVERIRSQRDRLRAAVRSADHAVEVARFEVASAQAVLDITAGQRAPDTVATLEVPAPLTGLVLRRHRAVEGVIQAGEAVLDLGRLQDLEVQVDLLSMDAVRVRPGMRVQLSDWGGEATLEGRVRRVEPAGFTRVSALGVDEQRVPVRVDFVDAALASKWLGVGYRVEARFVLWEGEDVVQIATSALFRRAGRWAVFVVVDGRAREREVQVGRRSGMRSQILDGLQPGDLVITHPGDRVRGGVRVRADHQD